MGNKLLWYIGEKPAKETAIAIMDKISSLTEKTYNEIELSARGRFITKTIDVLEILKRELRIYDTTNKVYPVVTITTNTEEMVNETGGSINVSTITINISI